MDEDQSNGKSTSDKRSRKSRSTGVRNVFRRLWQRISFGRRRTTLHNIGSSDSFSEEGSQCVVAEDNERNVPVRSSDSSSEEEGQGVVSKNNERNIPDDRDKIYRRVEIRIMTTGMADVIGMAVPTRGE
ncbi:uncharacterized protein LOC144425083 [Styela clava]